MKTNVVPTPTTPLADIFRLTPTQKTALAKLGITTARDLLYHFPSRYTTISDVRQISTLVPGERAIVYGRVVSAKTSKGFRTKIPMTEAVIEDGSERIKAIWFHQAYIAKMLAPGMMIKLVGTVQERKGTPYLANPEIEHTKDLPIDRGNSLFSETNELSVTPIYPESKGVTSRFVHHHIATLFSKGILDYIDDPIPDEILKRYHLPTLATALVWIHTPRREEDARSARKRFAFEEVFVIQLARLLARREHEKHAGFRIARNKQNLSSFIARFPFSPTHGQTNALNDILGDMTKGSPMARLLEGDVGSGKTFVAAAAAHTVVTNPPKDNRFGNLQVAYMAPTEILAEQHFKSFCEYFAGLPIEIGLLTGSGAKKFPSKVNPTQATPVSRAQLLKWATQGTLPILIGTHALIQKSVTFKNLALAIVDEQHRFGTHQRGKLAKKETLLPHFLSMTATPIPRTLALTIYGDLDITILDETPPGRLPIKTEIIPSAKREEMEKHISEEIARGRQAYVICPRIDEPDPEKELALNAKSVKEETRRLARLFPILTIDTLHGKMTPTEKEKVMTAFSCGKTNILVATSVVEVGVNVPNATMIVIEGAERFGLAQLHQLRGRVMRSTHQPYCYLLTGNDSKTSTDRLRALVSAKNGFELAELDLALRGSGTLSGEKQWGISDIGMEAIKNMKMVEAARTEARTIVETDPDLITIPLLKEKVLSMHKEAHWE